MTRNGLIWTAAALLAFVLVGGAAPARAQVSDERIRELIKQATDPSMRLQTPATAQPTLAADNRPVVALTLDDAVKFALDRNLDIAVQRLNPEINDILYASTRAVYKPALTSVLSTQSQTTPATSTLSGSTQQAGAPVVAGLSNVNAGLAQQIPWGGGAATVQLNNNKQTTTSANVLYNPTFNTNWSGSYTQPLLRNFTTDATRRTLQVTKLNRDISDVQLRAAITNTLSNVRNAYWDYVFALQSVDVARQSLDLAERLVRDNQTRVEVGHHGADRRRAGAVAVRHGATEPRRRAVDNADRGARAEAAHRRRHQRSELERAARSGRPAGLHAADRRHRGHRAARAQ